MSKETLRKKLINLRKNNYFEHNLSDLFFDKILKNINLNRKLKIGGYYPINSEIECFEILKKLEKKKYKIGLPIINKKNSMDFYEWTFKHTLNVN